MKMLELDARWIAATVAAALCIAGAAPAQDAQDAPAEPAAAAAAPNASAEVKPEAKSLEELLEEVRLGWKAEQQTNKQREAEFKSRRDEQARLVKEAEAAVAAAEARSQQLEATYNENEKQLAVLEEQKAQRMGNLGELFGVVRQVAGESRTAIEESITSTQLGRDRADFLLELGKSKKLPAIRELQRLWYELHREMTESGRVVRFDAKVTTPDGQESTRSVVRVGTFNAVSDGKYIVYDSETQGLKELAKQPPARYTSVLPAFEAATSGLATVALDPSRGQILSLLVNTRSLADQIPFGGAIGYTTIALGVFAALIAIWRWTVLFATSRRVAATQRSAQASDGDPLGRVLQVYEANAGADPETLELRLDEAIMKETGRLERFIWLIKVVSVVAPLLGLLGTVTGMIATFQIITLFGTGDPKMMASGISEALVTTMIGLMTAIPLVLLHAFVSASSKRIVDVLEEQSTGLVAARAEGSN
ncbi:MAG: MotA/TolQ/ExbB proton channel family protein [Myxococcota bacterium]|nr:MotA/TolQ/ExbB proton channel family protein [Myxococcales bacterium]